MHAEAYGLTVGSWKAERNGPTRTTTYAFASSTNQSVHLYFLVIKIKLKEPQKQVIEVSLEIHKTCFTNQVKVVFLFMHDEKSHHQVSFINIILFVFLIGKGFPL